MGIGNKIKKRRLELEMSVDDLAYKLNKNRATIYRYENGDIENLPTTILEPLAKALYTTPSYLMGWEDENPKDIIKLYDELSDIEVERFPLLGEIACGVPNLANEEFEAYVEVGANINADFCLRAKGDSMINARIYDGDIVFVKRQERVENGDIAVVIINDEATLKRFYYYEELNTIILRAENPSYKDIKYTGYELEDIKVIGKAIAFQSDII